MKSQDWRQFDQERTIRICLHGRDITRQLVPAGWLPTSQWNNGPGGLDFLLTIRKGVDTDEAGSQIIHAYIDPWGNLQHETILTQRYHVSPEQLLTDLKIQWITDSNDGFGMGTKTVFFSSGTSSDNYSHTLHSFPIDRSLWRNPFGKVKPKFITHGDLFTVLEHNETSPLKNDFIVYQSVQTTNGQFIEPILYSSVGKKICVVDSRQDGWQLSPTCIK